MQLCSIMSRDPKTTIKTIVAIFSLLVIVLILPRPVAALQTALVRASDGDVYQIRFRNRALDSGYDVGDFIDDFSIYNEAGTVELCPGNDEAVTWELYSVARVLAKTRSSTPVFSRDTLHETLIQAIEDQDLTPVLIAEKLLVREVVGNITSGIQSHTFLKGLSIVPKSGPAAIIVVPAVLISKLGNIEIRIRKLLYAFWIASTHADTAIVLQKLANQKAAALWNAINAGKIIDTFGGGFSVDTRSGEISGDIGVDGPLRLRLIAEVYQDNAERAAELGADLGKSEDAWFNWLEGLTGVGDILQLLTSLVDVPLLKGALEDLEASSGEKLRAKIKGEIENIYDSAAFSLRWHGFCTPGLRLNSAGFDVYEGHDLIYTVALDAPPEGVATIAVSSSNPDATVSPTMLTFTANDWYKPKPVRMVTVEDADIVNERVSLTHTATGYGEILPHGISFLIIDRKGNEAPELVDTIGPLSLSLDDEFRLDIADYFRDPEGSELRYSHSIVGQNFDVLRVKRDAVGSWITIRPQKIGSTTVNIWARDPEGLEAGYTFMVTVTAEENRAPVAVGTIPAQTLAVGDSSPSLDLSTYFRDPNNDILTYTTEQSNPDVALPQITGSQLTIWTLSTGSTTVTVKATNSADLFTIQTFTVTVTDAQNRAPVAVGTIPTQSLTIGSASPPLEVSVYFRDPNDDPLTYMAASSNPTVATAQRTGSQLTIWPRGIGTATITITAANLDGTFATQTFIVTVTDDEVPTERPTPQGLSVGDAVIVQNTGSDGLNVRSDPQVSNQNRDNKIGFLQDGATGTITDGPRQANNFIWWQIEWESSNKVHWTHQPTNKRGWSVEAIGEVGLLAIRPSEPITQSFDLAIQSFTISKNTLDPDESFTLSVTIHNNGPGDSPGPALSYYHSSIHGFAVTDPPQLQGTVQLDPLASGERITKSIPLEAPSTPKTYYYGAWLSANTGDTNLNNDFATEVGVTVIDDTISDPIDTSDPPDLVIANVSVDYDTMYPGERFTISATVRNTGGRQASNARVRYYRSSDQVFSADDEELANTDDFIGRLEGGETSDEDAHFDAPSEQGVYYYIVRADAVRNEVNTANNYDTIKITVLPPAAPDYVVSLSRNKSLVDPGEYVRFDATVLNQGKEDSRDTTTVRFYRSLDPLPSPDDEEIATDTIRALRDGRTDDGTENGPAPTEPGTYYYYACVDGVPEERDTDNNCSNVVTVNVRGPDLVVNSVSVDYFSKTNTVRPDGIFELRATVRNQGTDDADDSTLRYYISSDATLSSDDTEVATNFVYSLDSNETSSRTYRSLHIQVPYTSGFFYALVCVDGVESESDTTNNCFEPIKITVRNFKPGTDGTIPVQALTVGTSTPLDVSGYFADANNDDLTYTARSSDPKIATVRVSGPQVTLTPQRTGNVNVTVTASDGQLTATQTFSVSVMEVETKAPDLLVESVSLDKNTVTPGETFRLNAVVKNQGDADARTVPIRYYQSTDDTISETDTQLRTGTLAVITADGMRELSVALTAPNTPGTYYYGVGVENVADESDTANNYSIGVAISVENRAPSAVGTLPPRTLSENDAPVAVDVAAYFNDPDNTALTYTAASDNPAVVMAEMRGSEMTITPVGTGNAIVTVTASDGELAATQTLSVSVVAAPTENQAPLPVDVIPVQSLTVDGASSTVDISAYFSDANGDTLTYAAWPDDKNVVGLRREGTLLTITPKAAGRATVTVRARDPDGLQALQPISVFVSTTEVPVTELPAETWMPDANLRTAVRTALGLGPNDALTQQALQSLTSLRYLGPDLSDNQKITDLTGLEHALNLEHLDLYMHLISDLRPLERLTKLRSLWLAGNKIANIRPLTNLPLEELDLGGNPITDFAPLAELTSLTRLDFWGNGLGNSNLSIITGLTQLTQLDLRNNQISDVTTLTKLVNLKKLQLKGNPISDTAPLLTLTSQNPDLDIDIEISEEPPVKPDLVDPPDLSSEVTIPDANLRALVRALLGLQIGEVITGHGMQRLTRVIADGIGIKDLTGLEYATNFKGIIPQAESNRRHHAPRTFDCSHEVGS